MARADGVGSWLQSSMIQGINIFVINMCVEQETAGQAAGAAKQYASAGATKVQVLYHIASFCGQGFIALLISTAEQL